MKYSFSAESTIEEVLDDAMRHVKTRRELADALGCEVRTTREFAAQVCAEISAVKPEYLAEFEPAIIDSLHRPEMMTRYHALAALLALAQLDARVLDRARSSASDLDPIEDSLFDEESGKIRLNAFRLLAYYGSTTAARSEKVWPLLSEAIRCYHGDTEFVPMMNELIAMLQAKASPVVRQDAADLFCFDAENGAGVLKRKASVIAALAPEPPKVKEKKRPQDDDDEIVEIDE